jgi:hypothetical protein
VSGLPWWGAILLAAAASALGFAYDAGSGNKELSVAFAICYVAGCLLAVLAVRQSGIFTAVIQPPLILFVIVPTAYFVFHGSTIGGVKDLLINCGYPLIERFPLMFFTSAAVLVLGLVRWFLASSASRSAREDEDIDVAERSAGRRAAEATTIEADDATPRRRRRKHSLDRPSRTTVSGVAAEETPRRARKTTRSTPATEASRSRHARPPETEVAEPTPGRRRRRQGRPVAPPDEPPAEARRRTRGAAAREPRRKLPPTDGRGAQERPERRERPRSSERSDRYERPERRRRPTSKEPSESYDPFAPNPTSGAGSTHHPVSRVRYRGADDGDGEARTEHRTRSRRPYDSGADSWRYDV